MSIAETLQAPSPSNRVRPMADGRPDEPIDAPTTRVAIIGGGLSGIVAAIGLKQAGWTDVTILEKADSVGGVWRDNRYPGVRCDVPGRLFTYSFAPKTSLRRQYAKGSEVRDYLRSVHRIHRLETHTAYHRHIVRAIYRDGAWHLTDADGRTEIFGIVVWAGGILGQPKMPRIDGLDQFEGHLCHSARYDAGFEPRGKRVGIIGTGSSGVQMVPPLAKTVASLAVFQRTPHWICPINDATNRRYQKDTVPSRGRIASLHRRWQYHFMRMTATAAVTGSPWRQRMLRWRCENYLRRKVRDPALRSILTPDFELGCKRLIFARGYYESLQRPNVELHAEPIERIEPRGIRTGGRLVELDAIICATGFRAHRFMRPTVIRGIDGVGVDDYWSFGVRSHRSVAMPGFPNFFMVNGPHVPVGNYSAIDIAEAQVDYIARMLRPVRSGRYQKVMPRAEVTDRLQREIDADAETSVWNSGCRNWFVSGGPTPSFWPGSPESFIAQFRRIDPEEYEWFDDPGRPKPRTAEPGTAEPGTAEPGTTRFRPTAATPNRTLQPVPLTNPATHRSAAALRSATPSRSSNVAPTIVHASGTRPIRLLLTLPRPELVEELRRHPQIDLYHLNADRPDRWRTAPNNDRRFRYDEDRKKLSPRAILQVRRAIATCRPDVVHAFYGRAMAHVIAATSDGRYRPRLVSFRGISTPLNDRDPADRWTYLHPRFVAHACESEAVRRAMIESGISPDRCPVTYNYGSVPAVEPGQATDRESLKRSLGIPTDAFVIGTVARMRHVKGIDVLLNAADRLRDRGDIHFVLIGAEPDRFTKHAIKSATRRNPRLHVLGYRDDATALMPMMDVFVMPSRREALCRAVLEATAQGICPIVSDVGGLPEVVTHDIDGLVFAREDSEALADCILRLHNYRPALERLARAAELRSRDKFTVRHFVQRLLPLYRQALRV